ncbi:MAG: hypothetical protein ACI9YT_002291 [Halobacteriales archaeon]|jgi:hypothetical protein
MTAARTERFGSGGSSTKMNALIGAVVAIVAGPLLPFAAIVGGTVAGYLERGDLEAGARVGAFAGAIAAVPAVLGVFLFSGFFLGFTPLSGFAVAPIFVLFVLVVVPVYYLVAGGVGGAVGSYLRAEL